MSARDNDQSNAGAEVEDEYVPPPEVNVPAIAQALREANWVADQIDEIRFDLRVLRLAEIGEAAERSSTCVAVARGNEGTVAVFRSCIMSRLEALEENLGARLDDVQRAVAEHLATLAQPEPIGDAAE